MERNEIYTSYMYSYPHKTAYGAIAVSRAEVERRLYSEAFDLYMHIPFCETKCGYCNLFSVTGKQEADFAGYLQAMAEQAGQFGLLTRKVSWKSLTIGGGTPLILGERLLAELLGLARRIGALDTYSCIETSPNQTTAEKAGILKANQINRVSIGVQSFLDEELDILGRQHHSRSAKSALSILKDADFECLNLDLIYGIPSQSRESVRYSLEQAMEYEPDELFVYPLYIRKGTGLYGRSQVQHEDTYEFYWLIREYLLNHGYHQISMRRFAKVKPETGAGCGFEATLSLGCGGRSYIGDVHSCTPYAVRRQECVRLLQAFMEQPDKCRMDFGYRLSAEEQRRRYVIKNLLHTDGILAAEYEVLFGREIGADFPLLEELTARKYGVMGMGRYRLTPLGMSLSDYIGPMFISEDVKEKMARWQRNV